MRELKSKRKLLQKMRKNTFFLLPFAFPFPQQPCALPASSLRGDAARLPLAAGTELPLLASRLPFSIGGRCGAAFFL